MQTENVQEAFQVRAGASGKVPFKYFIVQVNAVGDSAVRAKDRPFLEEVALALEGLRIMPPKRLKALLSHDDQNGRMIRAMFDQVPNNERCTPYLCEPIAN